MGLFAFIFLPANLPAHHSWLQIGRKICGQEHQTQATIGRVPICDRPPPFLFSLDIILNRITAVLVTCIDDRYNTGPKSHGSPVLSSLNARTLTDLTRRFRIRETGRVAEWQTHRI